MKKLLLILGLMVLTSRAYAFEQGYNKDNWMNVGTFMEPAVVTSSLSVGASQVIVASVTAPSTQGGIQMYNYITNLRIEAIATGTVVGTSLINGCTTQNLPGSPQYNFPTAMAIGTQVLTDTQFSNAVKATTIGQAVLVTCPKAAGILWNIIIGSYQSN